MPRRSSPARDRSGWRRWCRARFSASANRRATTSRRAMPLLFSYGTLQQEAVQMSPFGRVLHGQPDALVGFEQSLLTIEDPAFVAASGKADHAIVKFNGRDERPGAGAGAAGSGGG